MMYMPGTGPRDSRRPRAAFLFCSLICVAVHAFCVTSTRAQRVERRGQTAVEIPRGQTSDGSTADKSSALALALSVGGTAVPILIPTLGMETGLVVTSSFIGGGAIFGPSLGHFYAPRPVGPYSSARLLSDTRGQAELGIGIRSFGTAIVGGSLLLASGVEDGVLIRRGPEVEDMQGELLFMALTGALTVAASALLDIVTAYGAPRNRDDEPHDAAHNVRTRISPVVGAGSSQIGLSLTVQF